MKNKFKIGDIVICVTSIDAENGGPVKGEMFKLVSVESSLEWYPYLGIKLGDRLSSRFYNERVRSGEHSNWGVECFRLATPEEINYHNFPNKLANLLEE